MSDADERNMRRALELAEGGRGLTSPNPMVGAVVVGADGQVAGEGFHRRAGEPHAEILALRAAGARTRGGTLYVTLEPCAHQGRTPPCVGAVVASGLARVVAALVDPNPLVAGRGLAELRHAGLDVATGVLADEAARQNRTFLTAMREHRPHVTLKAAMTLDGKIADVHGGARWITGPAARRHAHRLRSEADAIIVGVSTVLRDDPQLTVRLDSPWPREPWRVVLDTKGRTPPTARLITAGRPDRALIALGPGAAPDVAARLAEAGATVSRYPVREGRVDVNAVLEDLFARDVRAVLVEGGAEVHAGLLDAGLVDRVAVFVAPLLVGGAAAPGVVGGGGRELERAVRLNPFEVTRCDADILLEADVLREEPAARRGARAATTEA